MKKIIFSVAILSLAINASAEQWNAEGFQGQGQVLNQGTAQQCSVISVRTVELTTKSDQQPGMVSQVAPIAGGLAGGVIGSQVGQGTGSVIAGALGALGGAVLGNRYSESQQAPQTHQGQEIVCKLGSGGMIVVSQGGNEVFQKGDAALLITMGGTSRLTHIQ